ncbi:hypothetical protein B0H14DRAFT_2840834 [Mycena olivaceomarginata]|nr:hypothetical protein B0H14DRAFT_2840834 [Mycena olivaceomarginata]
MPSSGVFHFRMRTYRAAPAVSQFNFPSTMSYKKKVQWKPSVDEYVIRGSPKSWPSPLTTPSTPFFHPPPPPQPNQNLPLRGALELHPCLTPAQALKLDFSLPSSTFRESPLLAPLLDTSACNPAQVELHILVSTPLYRIEFDVTHTPHRVVTVGDILTRIQWYLRQYDKGRAPPEAVPYMRHRIATVGEYCGHNRDIVKAEHEGCGRFVDHLLGLTAFAGLIPQPGRGGNYLQVELVTPARYARP